MQFDATLNLAWAILGLFALAATARVTLRQNARERSPRWFLVVGLIVTALFPYISASDDILRLGHPQDVVASGTPTHAVASKGAAGKSQNNGRHQVDDLLRLYETLDTPLVCRLIVIKLQFLLVALVAIRTCAHAMRVAPDVAGRSPPFALAFQPL